MLHRCASALLSATLCPCVQLGAVASRAARPAVLVAAGARPGERCRQCGQPRGPRGRMWFSVVGRVEPAVSVPRGAGLRALLLESPPPGTLARRAAPLSPVITRHAPRCSLLLF